MVNKKLQEQRKFRIDEIKKLLKKLYKDGKVVKNRHNFIMQICVKYGVQQRKASEYLRIAEFMLK